MAHSRGLTNRAALLGGHSDQMQIRIDSAGEQDFDSTVENLHNKVRSLKRMVGDIDDETKQRGQLIQELEAGFVKAQAAMKETMRKMKMKLNEGWVSGNHMLILVIFALVMFLAMYAFIKGFRFLSWLFS